MNTYLFNAISNGKVAYTVTVQHAHSEFDARQRAEADVEDQIRWCGPLGGAALYIEVVSTQAEPGSPSLPIVLEVTSTASAGDCVEWRDKRVRLTPTSIVADMEEGLNAHPLIVPESADERAVEQMLVDVTKRQYFRAVTGRGQICVFAYPVYQRDQHGRDFILRTEFATLLFEKRKYNGLRHSGDFANAKRAFES